MIPPDRISQAIDAAYEAEPRDRRTYIGASTIGSDCDAFLDLCLRGFPDIPPKPRNKRIFRDGHRIEATVVADLRMAEGELGFVVIDSDPRTGKQWRAEAFGGHVAAHADAKIALTMPRPGAAILEVKSMNRERFEKFTSDGVKSSDPKYWEQAQFLMGLMNIDLALFAIYCKDDSSYAFEWVGFDDFFFHGQMARVELVLAGMARRKSEKKTGSCNWCSKRDGCWDLPSSFSAPQRECRTCGHSTPDTATAGAGWHCSVFGKPCAAPCESWQRYTPRAR